MPQLDFSTFPNQIFWLLIALAAIYFVLSRIALPRIGSVLAERQGTITNDIAAAEELKLKAREAEAAYDKALADARAEAGRIIEANKADLQSDLRDALAKADADIAEKTAESEARIDEIRAGAADAVDAVAKETAIALVEALGGSSEGDQVTRAVDTQLGGRT